MSEEELIEEITLYSRIDEDFGEIKMLKDAAEEYLLNAGIKKNYEKKLYLLAIKILVKHWYDNREALAIGSTSKEMEFSLGNIINQLQIAEYGDNNET